MLCCASLVAEANKVVLTTTTPNTWHLTPKIYPSNVAYNLLEAETRLSATNQIIRNGTRMTQIDRIFTDFGSCYNWYLQLYWKLKKAFCASKYQNRKMFWDASLVAEANKVVLIPINPYPKT